MEHNNNQHSPPLDGYAIFMDFARKGLTEGNGPRRGSKSASVLLGITMLDPRLLTEGTFMLLLGLVQELEERVAALEQSAIVDVSDGTPSAPPRQAAAHLD